jgi:hypothetical protein
VIKFTEDEIDTDRKFNRNKMTSNVYEQYVLRIDTGQTSKFAAGENRPVSLDVMLPFQSQLIVINTRYLNAFYTEQSAAALQDHVTMPYTLNELIASTVAHEIAHGVNVNHHGDGPADYPTTEIWEGRGNYHVFKSSGQEIPVSQWTYDASLQTHYYKLFGSIGSRIPVSQESGNLSCIMCYTSMFNWCYTRDANGVNNFHMLPILAVGKIFCTNGNATGINLKPYYFGPAMNGRGNCFSQIQLRN